MSTTSMGIHTYLSGEFTAAERIGGSHDLIYEILSRVPARSLFRFKRVSRKWRSIISDRRFALLNSKRNPKLSCFGLLSSSSRQSTVVKEKKFEFFLTRERPRLPRPPPAISFLESLPCSQILQSCNGLLMCSLSGRSPAYIVCNPSVKQFVSFKLPDEIVSVPNWKLLGFTLVFDPSRWTGFKVICSLSFGIYLYSSKERKWKMLFQGPVQNLNLAFEGVYWNGKVIWLCKSSLNFLVNSNLDSSSSNCLVFDVETEKFDPHKLPSSYSSVYYFGESMGHLSIVTKDTEAFNVYEFGENMKLSLIYKVSDHRLKRNLGGYLGISSSASNGSWIMNVVWKQEEIGEDACLLIWYVPSGEGKVISYNCKTDFTSLLESKTSGKTFQFIVSLYGFEDCESVSPIQEDAHDS